MRLQIRWVDTEMDKGKAGCINQTEENMTCITMRSQQLVIRSAIWVSTIDITYRHYLPRPRASKTFQGPESSKQIY